MQWVKVFYHGTNSIIINNGHFSERFQIKNGVRQGCPLSSFLFLISSGLLSKYIEKDNTIKGIHVNGTEIKQTLFADDTTFCPDGCKQSFEKLPL